MNTVSDTTPPDQPPMGFFSRFAAVFFEPGRAFDDLSRHPRWLVMALLVGLVYAGMSATMTFHIDRETLIRKGVEQNPMVRRMSDEQKRQIIEQAINNPNPLQSAGFVFAPVIVILSYIILAGIFLLAFLLLGASLTFKQSLAATVWGIGPPSIVVTLLTTLFILVKDPADLDVINPVNNVVSNLSILVNSKTNPVLHTFLGSIDVFSLWTIILLAIAFSRMSGGKLSTGKSAACIVVLWALYVAGKIGFSAFFFQRA